MNKNCHSMPNLNRLSATIAAATIALGSASTAEAANWFKLRGTEPDATTHTQQLRDSLQPASVNCDADSISGAVDKTAPLNSTLPVPNTVPPQHAENVSCTPGSEPWL